jgi:hypothetical protein
MNPQEIIALQPGPELDRAVNTVVFGQNGKTSPAYSTEPAIALRILDKLPLFVASVDPGRPGYNEEKPFVAGRLQHEQSVKGDVTVMRVTGPTLPAVLCRAALLSDSGTVKTKEPTMGERIGSQVRKRRDEQNPLPAARKKHVASLPNKLPQPSSRVSEKMGREPLPARKRFVPGALPLPTLPPAR